MGVTIAAVGKSTDNAVTSSIAHAVAAANACIAAAGIRAEEIDLLINAGVYRDANMVEPAMAALIHKALGFRLDFPNETMRSAFSFDVMNGACGVLNAVQVAAAYLLTGKIERALVVSSDAHPSNRDVPGYPYGPCGAALLLTRSETASAGFGPFRFGASPDLDPGTSGTVTLGAGRPLGAERIEIETGSDYISRLADLTAAEVLAYASEHSLDLRRTLLLTTLPSPTFGDEVTRRLGLPSSSAVKGESIDRNPHSSALAFAYAAAIDSRLYSNFEQLLFVGAGSGMATACVVYRVAH